MKPITIINIDGETLYNFEKVTLNQAINNHHTFSLVVDYDTVETVGSYTLDDSKEWLGKSIVINFNDTDFLGVITNVKLQHSNGFEGKLLVSGYSKTILLENGAHMHSWLHKSLDTIVNDTVRAAGLTAKINPVFKTPITYQAQYKENHFQFIQRLAKQYNEWLYYDGIQLVFGKPTLAAAITVEYGADMDTLNIAIEAIASTAANFSYNALHNVRDESKSRGRVEGLNELGSYAFDVSKELYSINTQEDLQTKAANKSEIDTFVHNQQGSKMATANVLSATSTKQGLTVGTIIKVTGAQRGLDAFEVKNYGEYIITKITHTATGSSEYRNSFEAISSGTAILPVPEVALPEATTQLATVLSNEDPKQKGRVEVQFQWQKHELKTSWIRVMTPDAGSSDHHAQNRGHVFIPEKGDQVMVGFRFNNPNQPFVMGSLFHGNNGAGGKDQNNYKSIITKSGHILEFNDTNKAESIKITDKKGNQIFIDTAGETITINALKDININAGENLNITAGKNINVNAGDNITENVGKNITTNAGGNIAVSATGNIEETSDNRTELVDKNFKRNATASNEIAGKVSMFSQKENMTLQSGKTVEFNSVEKSNMF
ncbi:type IV secretion protein Rhs [Tenacibaculum sp. Bg11-29]|uniref:type VI secretion system Vgr family protein n=1 Tax=Tenacibaculum sp. Bg11-29 TaxID=2058306 RepID=UPI000C34AF75|nr:phage baseplate assembly protein V [Tenacibaculum sp. Bg11-29]PKH49690.1 type IV secretion protein Rhs [Tenacibaculum sp. Bg11-29]